MSNVRPPEYANNTNAAVVLRRLETKEDLEQKLSEQKKASVNLGLWDKYVREYREKKEQENQAPEAKIPSRTDQPTTPKRVEDAEMPTGLGLGGQASQVNPKRPVQISKSLSDKSKAKKANRPPNPKIYQASLLEFKINEKFNTLLDSNIDPARFDQLFSEVAKKYQDAKNRGTYPGFFETNIKITDSKSKHLSNHNFASGPWSEIDSTITKILTPKP